MLSELGSHVEKNSMNKAQILFELGSCIVSAIDADSFNVYVVESEGWLSSFLPEDINKER